MLVLGFLWWDSHGQALGDFGNRAGVDNRTGSTALFALTFPSVSPSRDRIHILDVDPHVEGLADRARVRTTFCVPRGGGAGGVLTARGTLAATCTRSGPAVGATLTVGEARQGQLLLVVTSSRPARVVVDGATVTYRQGPRFGRQHVGMRCVARFTDRR